MRIKFLIVIFLSLLCNITTAQTFNYSYTDPCNGKVYNLSIPYGQNQIAVTYYGQVNTFTANDFNNGAFDNWAAGVFNQYQNASPCGSIGTAVTVSQTQSTALNVISIFGALSAISDMASSGTGNIMAAAGSVNNVGGGKGDSKPSDNKKENKNGDNSSGSTASGGSSSGSNGSSNNTENNNGSNGSSGSGEQAGGSSASGGTTGESSGSGEKTGESSGATNNNPGGSGGSGGTTNNGSGGSGGTTTSGSGSGGGTGNGSTPNQTDGGSDKKSDAVGGTTNAVKSGSGNSKGSATSKNGGRPSILMSSDLVGFQFNEGEVNRGSKVNAGYSSVRYDGLRSHGVMVDYTSSIQGGNITGYYAWINKKAITLLSNTVTIGFTGSGSMYNTIAFGQMRTIKKFKAVYMLTASAGQIYKESYYGSAAIVGGNRDFKIGKRVDIKTMALFVYAPFVRYYDDAVLKSPFVILPIVGVNLGVTRTFKLNFNFGGAYSIGDNVLNYTIMMGTRLAL